MPHRHLYACTVTSMPTPHSPWTRSRAFVDLVQPLFGRGAILPPGPGPATMPHRYPRATLSGLGPPHTITPRPNIGHTKAKTQSHLGQTPPGPGPATMPHRYPRATLSGLGPPHKVAPRPDIGHTKAKTQSHRGQTPPGPGPATFWTWYHFTPWTWSSTHKSLTTI